MSDVHGPTRRLVERAIQASCALGAAINPNTPRYVIIRAPLKPHIQALATVRAEADAHDSAYAALVQAAEMYLEWSYGGTKFPMAALDAKMRAALDAAKEVTGG